MTPHTHLCVSVLHKRPLVAFLLIGSDYHLLLLHPSVEMRVKTNFGNAVLYLLSHIMLTGIPAEASHASGFHWLTNPAWRNKGTSMM